jgi:ATP-dependent Clp protease ATP-binding subunit ClpA
MIRALRNARTLKQWLEGAERLSLAEGAELPGVEHLVLSALELPDGTARQAFAAVMASPADLRGAIETVHREAAGGMEISEVPPAAKPMRLYRLTPPAQEVFQETVRLSKADKLLMGKHAIIAACDQERGTFALALKELGIQRTTLAEAAFRL